MSWLSKIYPESPMPPCKLYGKAGSVVGFLATLGSTWPMETDPEWWQVYVMTMCWN